jgi:hypothetical protein
LTDIQDITDKDFMKAAADKNGIVMTFTGETLNNQKISPRKRSIICSKIKKCFLRYFYE